MASAWEVSWGVAWGNSWGGAEEPVNPIIIQSGTGAGSVVKNYRSYRFHKRKPDEITAEELREAARDLRADAQAERISAATIRETEELRELSHRLAYVDRLEAAVSELKAAVAFAERKRLEQMDDDDAVFLLTH